MNDKVKGLVLGLSLGIMLTGSVAYAGGTQIEVYFNKLKYMFDGVEKQPTEEQGAGFIYNGTTYVPLRFVSEALGKEVGWDGDTGTIWVGKRPSAVIAAYKGGQVTQGELDAFLAMGRLLDPKTTAGNEQQKGYKEAQLRQLIGYRVLAGRMTDEMKAALPAEVDAQHAAISQLLLNRQGAADLPAVLSKNGLTEQELRSYLELVIGAGKTLAAATTEAELMAAYEEQLKRGSLTSASVRHILIGFTGPNGKERSKDDALKLAKEVKDKLTGGEDFAALAAQYSEDPGSKDNGGLYADNFVDKWVEPFRNAAIRLELNKVSDPVETEYGYHVMRVESRKTYTLGEVTEGLRNLLASEKFNVFIKEELPGLIEKIDMPD